MSKPHCWATPLFALDKAGAEATIFVFTVLLSDVHLRQTYFSQERFDVLDGMGPRHFWYAGRRAMLLNMLDSLPSQHRALAVDIGCGPGAHLADWCRYADRVQGLDQYMPAVDAHAADPTITRIVGTVDDLPNENGSVDLAILLDVLEHVPEAGALEEIMRVLKPGGTLLVSVPAFQWLWSYRDEDAGHMRRYTKARLQKVICDAGLKVGRTRYYQFMLFPLVVATRKLGRASVGMRDREDQPSGLLNALFRWINTTEAWLDRRGVAFPVGSSILLLARKP